MLTEIARTHTNNNIFISVGYGFVYIVYTLWKQMVFIIFFIFQDISNCWEPNVCFNFLDEFLQHVKDTVTENDPR